MLIQEKQRRHTCLWWWGNVDACLFILENEDAVVLPGGEVVSVLNAKARGYNDMDIKVLQAPNLLDEDKYERFVLSVLREEWLGPYFPSEPSVDMSVSTDVPSLKHGIKCKDGCCVWDQDKGWIAAY